MRTSFLFSLLFFTLAASAQKDGIYRDLDLALSEPDKVITLDLSSSGITALPSSPVAFKQLEGIFLNDNDISKLPEWIGQLPSLKRLVLDNNPRLDIDQVLSTLRSTALAYLSLNNCNVHDIPEALTSLKDLERLSLASNDIIFVPLDIENLQQLAWLDLSANPVKVIAPELWNCQQLQYMDLSEVELPAMDTAIAILSTLENLQTLRLEYKPSEYWSQLRTPNLILRNGKIGNEFSLAKMSQRSIVLESCNISDPNFFRQVALNTSLKDLAFIQCELPNGISGIEKAAHIEYLEFRNCDPGNFDVLKGLVSLKTLKIFGCPLNSLQLQELKQALPSTAIYAETQQGYAFTKGPVENIQVPVTNYVFNAGNNNELVTENVKINFPAGAFIDKNGQPVTGNIQVAYREFFDPVSIALSGIDMRMDTLAKGKYMSSAGMFEIKAFNGEEELKLDPTKKATVELSPAQLNGNFGLFATTENTDWSTLKNKIEYVKKPGRVPYVYSKCPPRYPQFSPQKCRITKGSGENFKIHIDNFDNYNSEKRKSETFVAYPEIDFLTKYTFVYNGPEPKKARKQIDSLNRLIRNGYKKTVFESLLPAYVDSYNVEPDYESDCYTLILKFRGKTYKYPVFLEEKGKSNSAIQEKNKIFYTKWNTVKNQLGPKLQQREKYVSAIKKYEERLAEYKSQNRNREKQDNPYDRIDNSENGMKLVARFNLAALTAHNIDQIFTDPAAAELLVNYKVGNDFIKPLNVILINPKENTAFVFKGDKPLLYNSEKEYRIIVVLDSDHIGVADAPKIKKAEGSGILELKLIDTRNKNINDLRASL